MTLTDDIISLFDFEAVHDKMVKMDWRWTDGKGGYIIPNVLQLTETAKRLCTTAEDTCGKTLKETKNATGGFVAMCSYRKKQKCLQLFFSVEHAESWSA